MDKIQICLLGVGAAFIAASLSACGGVNATDAKRVLAAQGMKNVVIGDYAWFGCGKDDSKGSHFTANGADGTPISGVVCSGFFKGITVRFD